MSMSHNVLKFYRRMMFNCSPAVLYVIITRTSTCLKRSCPGSRWRSSHCLPFLVFEGLGLPVIHLLILCWKFGNHLFVHVRAPWGVNRHIYENHSQPGDSDTVQHFYFFHPLACGIRHSAFPSYLVGQNTNQVSQDSKLSPHSFLSGGDNRTDLGLFDSVVLRSWDVVSYLWIIDYSTWSFTS